MGRRMKSTIYYLLRLTTHLPPSFYPYVYRILNSTSRAAEDAFLMPKLLIHVVWILREFHHLQSAVRCHLKKRHHPLLQETADIRHPPVPGVRASISANGEGFAPTSEEPDPDAQLLTIIGHISSETTGAMHKEGITELHHFIKAYPHKKPASKRC